MLMKVRDDPAVMSSKVQWTLCLVSMSMHALINFIPLL